MKFKLTLLTFLIPATVFAQFPPPPPPPPIQSGQFQPPPPPPAPVPPGVNARALPPPPPPVLVVPLVIGIAIGALPTPGALPPPPGAIPPPPGAAMPPPLNPIDPSVTSSTASTGDFNSDSQAAAQATAQNIVGYVMSQMIPSAIYGLVADWDVLPAPIRDFWLNQEPENLLIIQTWDYAGIGGGIIAGGLITGGNSVGNIFGSLF